MKRSYLVHSLTAAIGLTVLVTAGCSKRAAFAEGTLPSAKVVAATAIPTGATEPAAPVQSGPKASLTTASSSWADIKDLTYDMRAQFLAGLKQLENKVDTQAAELTAKRAAMTSAANPKDWDFAMQEMASARTYLHSTIEEMGTATPETWSQYKDKVGKAWLRTQDAYAKVKSSTTG